MFVVTPLIAALWLGSTFWTGVAVSGALAHNEPVVSDEVTVGATTTDHQDACAARYHSYVVDRDSYMGYDGEWHLCRL